MFKRHAAVLRDINCPSGQLERGITFLRRAHLTLKPTRGQRLPQPKAGGSDLGTAATGHRWASDLSREAFGIYVATLEMRQSPEEGPGAAPVVSACFVE